MAVVRPRLLFLITEDWFFWSHRLDLARAARDSGFDVFVATNIGEYGERINAEGFTSLPIRLARKSRNPLKEIAFVLHLANLYHQQKPDIVHHIGIKPILYGSWASRLTDNPLVVNSFAGLGIIFSNTNGSGFLVRNLIRLALRSALATPRSRVTFENRDDYYELLADGLLHKTKAVIIRGSVDPSKFIPVSEHRGKPLVVLAARMLWPKGIGEFVEASRILKKSGIEFRPVLVGRVDKGNPTNISEAQLLSWQKEGVVEWWGHVDDMVSVFASAHIVVLPTYYGEGIPKVLLEAASCGKPIVGTEQRGVHEIVREGENGLLVPPRDPKALAHAIAALLRDPVLRARMGRRGRQIVLDEFSITQVTRDTLAIYRELLVENGHLAGSVATQQ